MKQKFNKIVTLLLVLAMLIGVVSTTVFAAGGEGGEGGSDEQVSGSMTTDLFEISYDENGITVTLDPEVKHLLGARPADIKAALQLIVKGVEDIVVNDIKNQLFGSGSQEPGYSSAELDVEALFTKAVDDYIQDNTDGYLPFIKALTDDTNVDESGNNIAFEAFCSYIKAMIVDAVTLANIDPESLPEASAISARVLQVFETEFDKIIDETLDYYVVEYLKWVKGEPSAFDTDADGVKPAIDSFVKIYVESKINNYIADIGLDTPAGERDAVDAMVAAFMDDASKAQIKAWLQTYADGTLEDDSITEMIEHEMEIWIAEVVAGLTGNPPADPDEFYKHAMNKLQSSILADTSSVIKSYINKYLNGDATLPSAVKFDIEGALKNIAPSFVYELYVSHWKANDALLTDAQSFWSTIHTEVKTFAKPYVVSLTADNLMLLNPALSRPEAEGQAEAQFETVFASLTYDDVKDMYSGNFDKDAVSAVSDKLSAYTSDDWKKAWDALESEQDDIVVLVEASDAWAAIVKHMVDDYYWATDDGGAYTAEAVANRRESIKDLIAKTPAPNFNAIIEDIFAYAELNYRSSIESAIREYIGNDGENIISTLKSVLESDLIDDNAALVDAVNAQVTSNLDNILVELIGKSKTEILDTVKNVYIPRLLAVYTETAEELKADVEQGGSPDVDISSIIGNIRTVAIDGAVIFAAGRFDVDTIIDFIFSLPTFEEISKMQYSEMRLDYVLSVDTKFGTSEFDLSVVLAHNENAYKNILEYSSLIAEHLDFYMNEDGVIVFDLKIPEKFASLVLRAAKSDKVPDELKKKVFSVFDTTTDEAFALIANTTLDDILKVFDYVDFEGLIDNSFLAQFEKLDGLTTEQIKNKIKSYEDKYETLVKYLSSVSENLPEALKSISILNFYEGEGNFALEGEYDIDVESLIGKFSEKYAALIASFMSKPNVELAIDFSLTFDSINKVEYVLGDEVYSAGLLPVGADIYFFAEANEYQGFPIIAWVDADNKAYTTMPDKDITLYAVIDKTGGCSAVIDSEIKKVYDGETSQLKVNMTLGSSIPTDAVVTFQWYKDGTKLGSNLDSLSVVNVKDSGEYYCEVTINSASGKLLAKFTSNKSTVEITKADLDLTKYTWKPATMVYNGEVQFVYLVDSEGNKLNFGVSYVVDENYTNSAINADTYTAKAIPDTDNFNVNGTVEEFEWTIEKATYDMSSVKWLYVNGGRQYQDGAEIVVIYDGKDHVVKIDETTLPEGVTATISKNTFKDPKTTNKIVAEFTGNPNYNDIPDMTVSLRILGFNNLHTYTDTDGTTVVEIVAANGVLETYELSFKDVSTQYTYFESEEIFGEGNVGYVRGAYDIHFTNDGALQPVTDEFTVKLLMPVTVRSIAEDTIKVVYVSENGTVEDMLAVREGDYLVFETTHFSLYSVVEIGEAPVEPEESDYTWLWILIAVLAVLLVAAIIVIIVLKKRKGGNDGEPNAVAPETEPTEPEAQEAVIEEAAEEPVAEEPVAEEPVAEEPVAEEPVAEEPVAEEPVAEEPVAEEPAAEEPVAEEPVAEEPVAEEPVAEEPVAEEPAAEEPVAEEPVAEEPKVEEPVVVEEPKPAPLVVLSADDAEGIRMVNGEIVHVRYRTSFMSRLIQAEGELQDYYTIVKNALLSYKGVKARTSWNFESFNKGRVQCAKLNIKGSAFQVYLALDPNEYNANKYHFTDVSDKPKLDQVPMLLKVKSERGLKYALELIEEMMNKLGMEKIETPNVDYHMPYETTEALAARDLVKVILPAGVTLDSDISLVKLDVGALLDEANADKASEAPAVTAEPEVVAEPEVAAEPEVVAEPEPEVEVTEEAPAVEETVHVDAVQADVMVSDEKAKEQIEIVERTEKLVGTKLCEINLDTICENFEDGDEVTLAALKAKRLISNKAGKVKILARGVMTKKLTIFADKYSLQAVKMITLAGGHAEQYK